MTLIAPLCGALLILVGLCLSVLSVTLTLGELNGWRNH